MMAGTQIVLQSAGAVPRVEVEWHGLNWRAAHQNVRRLQACIVKATQEGRWGKVKALQHLLTHSLSGKALAVKRVTENQGKNTPGVDKVLWNTPEQKMEAVQTLKRRGYRPQPLRRVHIPKRDGKTRPLGIPTMKDRAMQALYLLALDPVAESTADGNSYGFRRERCCGDAIQRCFTMLAQKDCAEWILDADIASCFDRISHEWLLAHVPMDKRLLEQWLKSGYMERGAFWKTEEGTPQGGIISPVLANLALDGLEARLRQHYPEKGKGCGKGLQAKVHLIRYADDFVITGASQEVLEYGVKPLVVEFLRERGLELSPHKTVIRHITQGFDFLGQTVRKYQTHKGLVLLIKPSKKSVHAFLEKIRKTVKENKSLPAGELIKLLNPQIRGWANYHRHVVSKRIFACVDHAIFWCLWRWTKRRHPKKPASWVSRKYFKSLGLRQWVFYGFRDKGPGQSPATILVNASDTPIRRHIGIKGAANPYDPQWELYFEHRLGLQMSHSLQGRRNLRFLWHEQKGICPVCHQKITLLTGWHNHHIVWRVQGGSDVLANRILLHPHCHQIVHSQGLTVRKPRPQRGVD